MTTSETRKYEMFVRVDGFGDARQEQFPANSLAGQAFKKLKEAVIELRAHRVKKQETANQGRRAKASARRALIAQVEHISRSAGRIALEHERFDDPFQMPRGRGDEAFITAGHTFLKAAERVKDRFIEYGMPADFIDELRACVETFEQVSQVRQVGRDQQTEARASINRAMESAFAALQTLDSVMSMALVKDPVTLAVWEQDRRIDYTRRSRRASTVVPVAEPAAAPAAPALEKAS